MATAGRNTLASSRENRRATFQPYGVTKIAVRAGWPQNQTLETRTPQIVGHLRPCVFADGHAEQIGDQVPQVAVVEAIDQVLKTGSTPAAKP